MGWKEWVGHYAIEPVQNMQWGRIGFRNLPMTEILTPPNVYSENMIMFIFSQCMDTTLRDPSL